MMVETAVAVVVVLSTHNTAQFVRALIQMEAGVEQLAHLLQQRPLIQVICTSIKLVRNIFLIQVLYCMYWLMVFHCCFFDFVHGSNFKVTKLKILRRINNSLYKTLNFEPFPS